ncbi:MAG TPA: sulfotransferase, partial [Candidatus Acidoferrales bacterium]|nr:sulfotransferase [Candidatus Acidoferrales bacterium]
LEGLLEDEKGNLLVDDRLQIHFGLGKAYDTEDDIERAFAHLRDGNALARSLCQYNEDVHLREMELLTQLFNKTLLGAFNGEGDPSETPVFIFGMPRSGTTLVEQILAAHPHVYAGGEIGAIMDVMHQFANIDANPTDVPAFREAFVAQLRTLGARYVTTLQASSSSAMRVTDKWPWSFKFLGVIHLILPNARLIHVRRSPADTCFSCFSTVFSDVLPYMYDQAELGRYYRAYEKAMDYWLDALPPGRVFEIRYEDLIEDFETEARRLVAHCGLEWNDACLQFWTARRPVRTASAVAVRQPLHRRALGRAQAYGAHLAPLLASLAGNNQQTSSADGAADELQKEPLPTGRTQAGPA